MAPRVTVFCNNIIYVSQSPRVCRVLHIMSKNNGAVSGNILIVSLSRNMPIAVYMETNSPPLPPQVHIAPHLCAACGVLAPSSSHSLCISDGSPGNDLFFRCSS